MNGNDDYQPKGARSGRLKRVPITDPARRPAKQQGAAMAARDEQRPSTRSSNRNHEQSSWYDRVVRMFSLRNGASVSTSELIQGMEMQYKHDMAQEAREHAEEIDDLEEGLRVYEEEIEELKSKISGFDELIKAIKQKRDQKHQKETSQLIQKYEHKVADMEVAAFNEGYEKGEEATKSMMSRQLKDAEDRVEMLEGEIRQRDQRCSNAEALANDLKAQVKSMQEASLRNVEAEHWAPLAVSDIDRKLKSILADVKQWSTKYATFSLQEIAASPYLERLKEVLEEEDCTSSAQALLLQLENNKSMIKKPGKAASLLLAAVVSSVIVRSIIGDPFFAFGGLEGSTLLLREEKVGLVAALEHLQYFDEAGAHAWRCQLFRLLDPPVAAEGTEAEQAKITADESRKAAAGYMAWLSLRELGDVLIPVSTLEAATEALEVIFLRAAELAWTFQTRKQSVEVLDLPIAYTSGASDLEPSPLHSAEMEEEPESLEGRKVVLMCSPAVVAHGTADGTDYDKATVWRKGVVWLG